MRLELFGERIAVKQHDAETQTASGLIIAAEPGKKRFQGEVVAVGEGKVLDNGTVRRLSVKLGDVVLFGEYSGQKFSLDGEDYLMMNESDVIGILR